MTAKLHLWTDEPITSNGKTTSRVLIEYPTGHHRHLWYRVPTEHRWAMSTSSDHFVLGTIFLAMSMATDMVVHGQLSPSLLRNLDEFQAAWSSWHPDLYQRIEITAETEQDQPEHPHRDSMLVAFSGGVDSAFTALRHRTNRCGRLQRSIQAGMMIHGFDIPLEDPDAFRQAAARSRQMLSSLELDLITVETNYREFDVNWVHSFAAASASCLMLLQQGYGGGLIGASVPYMISTPTPWGSNPTTDWLLSSSSFALIHDGAAFTRLEKLRLLADWPEALQYLRVCWAGSRKDRNCGVCEKCVRTLLSCRALGLPLPACFEREPTDEQIATLKVHDASHIDGLEMILTAAKAASQSGSWMAALEQCIQRNRWAAKRRAVRQAWWRTVQPVADIIVRAPRLINRKQR